MTGTGEKEILTERFRNALRAKGAALVGFADLGELPAEQRQGFPRGILIAMPWDPAALRSIEDGPTSAYHADYDGLNERLDALATYAESWLTTRGHRALAKTRAVVRESASVYGTLLPHKTVATRAGVGWIGKCALLVTRAYGSAVRISSILTDAPLQTDAPIDESACGSCEVCAAACPAGAVSGKPWHAGLPRAAFWDAEACRRTARERSLRSLDKPITLCGLCILRCPWTQRYLESVPPHDVL
ncbi:MAG: 4Fe-4S binding protein [Clostridia bacterium]|nr:4Fe-4S binding protein [Clostridia bacterium]